MHNHIPKWQLLSTSIKKQVPCILMLVVQSEGSSPGRTGFFMVVNANGEMQGSVGGGIMEHKFVELAKTRLADNSTKHSLHKQNHNKFAVANQSGMICSGAQTILLYSVHKNDLYAVNEIIECLENNRNGYLHLTPNGLDFYYASTFDAEGLKQENEDWEFRQRIGYANKLYIVGGGHCALALSRIMCLMDFYIVLIDDRENLNTMDENTFVYEKKVVHDYAEVSNIIYPGINAYVIVMTLGYRTDDIVIRSLAGGTFKYFGVLGSSSKMAKMIAGYKNEGMDELWLDAIKAPAGLNIKSQTPEEIAISIAGEIIQVKNNL